MSKQQNTTNHSYLKEPGRSGEKRKEKLIQFSLYSYGYTSQFPITAPACHILMIGFHLHELIKNPNYLTTRILYIMYIFIWQTVTSQKDVFQNVPKKLWRKLGEHDITYKVKASLQISG